MNERRPSWEPSEDEVEHIREELRPIIARLARRAEATLAEERWRRETFVER